MREFVLLCLEVFNHKMGRLAMWVKCLMIKRERSDEKPK